MLFHVLLALAAVIATGRALGAVCRWVGQPPVIGEILAGIVLGPSLLGRFAPEWASFVLPESVAPQLAVLAQFGVVLYMFCMGLEFDFDGLSDRGRPTLIVAAGSLLVPFVCGALLALLMPQAFVGEGIAAGTFALFIGTAMAVTAFPVLARILSESGLGKSELGTTALACAAVGDAGAWCLLAIVTGVAHSEIRLALVVLGLTLVFLLAMLFVVRPLIVWWAKRYDESPSRGMLAAAFLALLAAALTAEAIGIHAIFGAFALGAVVPHDSKLSATLRDKLIDLVTVLLLPAFFAFAGMRTELGLVSGWQNWLWCVAVIVVATLGKLGGTMATARWCGFDVRQAMNLGVLMNTRGLMELVVLNIGLDLGIITPTIFAMLVVMALVTTLATTPVLAWLNRGTAING